jgi:hypothetical protein
MLGNSPLPLDVEEFNSPLLFSLDNDGSIDSSDLTLLSLIPILSLCLVEEADTDVDGVIRLEFEEVKWLELLVISSLLSSESSTFTTSLCLFLFKTYTTIQY